MGGKKFYPERKWDLWAISKTEKGKMFRLESDLNLDGVDRLRRKWREIYKIEHYHLTSVDHGEIPEQHLIGG